MHAFKGSHTLGGPCLPRAAAVTVAGWSCVAAVPSEGESLLPQKLGTTEYTCSRQVHLQGPHQRPDLALAEQPGYLVHTSKHTSHISTRSNFMLKCNHLHRSG